MKKDQGARKPPTPPFDFGHEFIKLGHRIIYQLKAIRMAIRASQEDPEKLREIIAKLDAEAAKVQAAIAEEEDAPPAP